MGSVCRHRHLVPAKDERSARHIERSRVGSKYSEAGIRSCVWPDSSSQLIRNRNPWPHVPSCLSSFILSKLGR